MFCTLNRNLMINKNGEIFKLQEMDTCHEKICKNSADASSEFFFNLWHHRIFRSCKSFNRRCSLKGAE